MRNRFSWHLFRFVLALSTRFRAPPLVGFPVGWLPPVLAPARLPPHLLVLRSCWLLRVGSLHLDSGLPHPDSRGRRDYTAGPDHSARYRSPVHSPPGIATPVVAGLLAPTRALYRQRWGCPVFLSFANRHRGAPRSPDLSPRTTRYIRRPARTAEPRDMWMEAHPVIPPAPMTSHRRQPVRLDNASASTDIIILTPRDQADLPIDGNLREWAWRMRDLR
jgi:hypothetical protein